MTLTDAECDAIRRRELVAARMLTGGGTQRSIAYQYALIRAAFAAGAASVPRRGADCDWPTNWVCKRNPALVCSIQCINKGKCTLDAATGVTE